MKAQLMAQLEKALRATDEAADLSMGAAVRQQVGQALPRMESEPVWPESHCPSCGQVMHYSSLAAHRLWATITPHNI